MQRIWESYVVSELSRQAWIGFPQTSLVWDKYCTSLHFIFPSIFSRFSYPYIIQWFSNFGMHQNHLEGSKNYRPLDSTPGVSEFALLTSSQLMIDQILRYWRYDFVCVGGGHDSAPNKRYKNSFVNHATCKDLNFRNFSFVLLEINQSFAVKSTL